MFQKEAFHLTLLRKGLSPKDGMWELIDLANAKRKKINWFIDKYNNTSFTEVQLMALSDIIKEKNDIAVIERELERRGYVRGE